MESIAPAAVTHTANPNSKPSCYHCGETCPDATLRLEEKVFCCSGCKLVYEILAENDLCRFYEIEAQPGTSLKGRRTEQYAYLDDPAIREQLLVFTDGNQSRIRFHLPQIHCASCIWLLENLHRLHEGILHATVHFPKKEIDLSYLEEKCSLRQVVELLVSIGYTPAISLQDLDKPLKAPVDRRLFYQIGVAGFAFGNIMLLSFPEYLGIEQGEDLPFQRFFGYLNILLALPVVFYSGWDYLRSAFIGLRHRHLNMDVPISLGILALFLRSSYEILSLSGAGYLDSLAGLVLFLLAGKWFQQRTYQHLSFERDYRSYFPIAATVRTGDAETVVPVNKLEIGQTILVRNGELIPADGLLVKGEANIDYSFVSGEAEPVPRAAGEKVYAGGRQLGSGIEITLLKKADQSYLTQLWNEEAFQKEQKSKTGRLADRVATYFTVAILTIATATLVYWLPKDVGIAINAFTAVLIIACPCAVALSVPFTFGNSLRILGYHRFFLKNIHVIESLAQTDTIVFDKTGTLTENRGGEVRFTGTILDEGTKNKVAALVHQSQHPLSRVIDRHLGVGEPSFAVRDFRELPGQGLTATIDGESWRLGSRAFITGEEGSGVYLMQAGAVLGYFEVETPYRVGLAAVLASLRKRFQVFLLSGDNDRERTRLAPMFGDASDLHFQQSPIDKLRFIEGLQEKGGKVLMLGDGLNDAGALQQSQTGIVLAEHTNNFTPASDAILDARAFPSLPTFLAFARGNIRLVYAAYFLALIYNIIGLSYAVQGTLSPVIAAILMPSSSLTIVLFGVFSSNWLAWKLGLGKEDDKNHLEG